MRIQSFVLIVSLIMLHAYSALAMEADTGSTGTNSGPIAVSAAYEPNSGTSPSSKRSSTSGNTLIYGGVGLVAIGAVLAVAGSGGGSDSSTDTAPAATSSSTPAPVKKEEEKKESKPRITTPKDTNTPGSEPVGPDIRGDNWSGFLDLVHGEKENVTASVTQNGTYVVITTSSSQEYGRKFVGNINTSGSIRVYDQKTGELWTTHYAPASDNEIDLYDYVDNYKALDRLYLSR